MKRSIFIPRAKRVLASLAVVVCSYLLYSWILVPWIEPVADRPPDKPVDEKDYDDAKNRPDEIRKEFAWCFKPGDWELDTPLVLESPDGKLLMKKYTTLPDGRVELKPCTMVFMPRNAALSERERCRRATILRAPQGAILEFDTPFDLKQPKMGRLVGGQLMGEVTIQSDQRSPGPEDDLFVATRNVKLTETEITTPERVDFRLGPNFGHGRDLIVHLRPKNAAKPDLKTEVNFGGMTSLELLHDVNMHLQSAAGDFFPGSKGPKGKETAATQNQAKPAPAKPQPPIEVKCDGKFRFDTEKYVATFQQNVDVLRLNPTGPSDQMTCELLSLFFEAVPEAAEETNADAVKTASKSKTEASKKSQGSAKLEATRIEARGNPVVVRAPSNGVQARGQQLDYNIKTGAGKLRDGKEVYFLQGRNEIHSRELYFQPSQTSRLGQFKASGPGWYKGVVPSESRDKQPASAPQNPSADKTLEARWSKHLFFRPDQQNQLLSIEGNAHVQSAATGMIDSDQIHLWLLEPPPGTQSDNSTKTGGPGGLQPDRLLALGHVRIDSPQLTGRVERMEAWFEQLPARIETRSRYDDRAGLPPVDRTPPPHLAGPIMSPPRGPQLPMPRPQAQQNPFQPRGPEPVSPYPTTATPGIQQNPIMNVSQPPRQAGGPFGLPGLGATNDNAAATQRSRYHVDGELLRARITRRGEVSEMSEVVVQRKVHFTETKTEKPDELPLTITGDQLHLVQPQPNAALVTITGGLAHVEARGMTIDGGTIKLDQGKNRLWIDGKGEMTLPVNRNMDGQAAAAGGRLKVTWQGRMDFNGTLAAFERGVEALHQRDKMLTEVLEVTLDRQIKFDSSTTSQQPEVRHLACHGGAYMESHKFDERGKPLSIDKLQTKDLDVDQQSGNIKGQGPGWLTSVRWSDGQTLAPPGPPQPGQLPPNGAAGMRPQPGQQNANAQAKKEQLVFLEVKFQRQMSGNLHQKNMLFEQNIRTIYGNVPTWDDTLDANSPEAIKPGDVLMTCQQLAVSETPGQAAMPGAPAVRNLELAATGNARVDGKTEAGMDFYSQSARLTYSQIKDLLVLEGDGRSEARLFRQTRIGGPMSEAAARTIMYWRSTNRAQADVQFLDLTDLPGGEKKR